MEIPSVSPISVGSINTGALLGTSGTAALLDSINESLGGSSFFGSAQDTFRDLRASFITSFIQPIKQAIRSVSNVITTLLRPDEFRPLTEPDHLKIIPPCMYEPIIMHPPVLALLKQGRISGFGFDPDYLSQEDVWGRLIENGVVRDVLAAVQINEEGEQFVEVSHYWLSTDPETTDEQLDAVERTRALIDHVLSTTLYDPTDFPEERG